VYVYADDTQMHTHKYAHRCMHTHTRTNTYTYTHTIYVLNASIACYKGFMCFVMDSMPRMLTL